MRQILLVLIVIVIAVGFYRGWFRVTSEGTDGQHHITLTVDKDKIKADEKQAQEKLPTMGHTTTDHPAPAEPGKN